MKITKPLYVIAVNYDERNDFFSSYCLGWSNATDWYDDNSADELLTASGNLKTPKNDLIVSVGESCIYASSDLDKIRTYAEDATKEGIDCTICEVKLNAEKDDYELSPAVSSIE